MTLILTLDLDIVKMYHHTRNEVFMSRHSKVIIQTDTQTDRCTDTQTHRQYQNITFPHTRVVKTMLRKGHNAEIFIICMDFANHFSDLYSTIVHF